MRALQSRRSRSKTIVSAPLQYRTIFFVTGSRTITDILFRSLLKSRICNTSYSTYSKKWQKRFRNQETQCQKAHSRRTQNTIAYFVNIRNDCYPKFHAITYTISTAFSSTWHMNIKVIGKTISAYIYYCTCTNEHQDSQSKHEDRSFAQKYKYTARLPLPTDLPQSVQ